MHDRLKDTGQTKGSIVNAPLGCRVRGGASDPLVVKIFTFAKQDWKGIVDTGISRA
jgi:hypothetical protein